MGGVVALVGAFLAFCIPLGVPLAVQSWRAFGIVVVAGALFFALVNFDLSNPNGVTQLLGPFLFGLMLFGFAAGVIAKFVMLVGRR